MNAGMYRKGLFALALCVSVAALAPAAVAQDAKKEEEKPVLVLITNVDVWDGTSDSAKRGVDVLVEDTKIKRIAKDIKAPGANVIASG